MLLYVMIRVALCLIPFEEIKLDSLSCLHGIALSVAPAHSDYHQPGSHRRPTHCTARPLIVIITIVTVIAVKIIIIS